MKAYEELAELADAPRDQALLADALTYAGHYQAALDGLMVFNQEENQGPLPRDYEWVLKEMMLAEIVNERGITHQDRHAVVLEPAPTEAAELDQVLRQDALAPMVWWNLGVHRFEAGDISDAALPFLAAALITGWDANAWAHAFAGFFFQARIDLLPLLLSTGERMSQGQMVPALTKLVKGQDEKFPRQQFLAVLRQQLEALPSDARDATEIRMLRDDGSVESVMVPAATAPAEDPSPDTAAEIPQVGRNEPCPCGSGRKYKKCHGAD